jgi:RNA polymerase sigma factor (sigma-70 family)
VPDGFEEWYAREHPRVLAAMAARAGDVRMAEEVTAEAFTRALERWERVREMESPGGWVHRVATNLVKRRKRRQLVEQTLLRREAPEPAAPAMVDSELWEAVRALSPRQRTAIIYRFVGDLPHKKIAEAMSCSEEAARRNVHEGLRKLREVLKP